jgi:hypothetical protein
LDLALRIERRLFAKEHALRQFFGKPFRERILHRLLVKGGPGASTADADQGQVPCSVSAASVERLLARPGIPVATPLHGARDHDEAVAATAQWFGGLARQLPPLFACA